MFFTFQKDAHWTDRAGRGVRGRDRGVSRRVFRRLLPVRPTPERCVEAYPPDGDRRILARCCGWRMARPIILTRSDHGSWLRAAGRRPTRATSSL